MNDEEQLKFINNRDIQNCIIIGNPGCGKTKTIIDFCINNSSKSNEFLIITFSKKAQLDLINKGQKLSNNFNIYNIKTIHSLSATIFKKLFNKSSENINTLILATYKNIIDKDISIVSCLKKCRFIIIDEAQDINENQYNLIKLIANKLNIPLILVGDPNQNIYQFQGGSDKYLLNHSNNKHLLINNYRSTNQIIDFCNYLRPHNELPLMVCKTNKNGNKPLLFVNSIENIKKHIKEEILKSDCNLHEIAIIGSVKLSKNYASIGLQMICNYLHENNINYIKYFKDDDNINFDNNEKIEVKENHVNILTCHSSKGLEFKKVLVINYHFNTFTRTPTEVDYNNFKYLWYVTFTRAIEKLIIYSNEEKIIFPNIQDVPEEYYNLESEKPLTIPKLKFNNDKQISFPIVDTIANNKYFNENNYYNFETSFKHENIKETKLFKLEDDNEIFEYNQYSKLYGLFFEELFTYYWYKNNKSIADYINDKTNYLKNIISIYTQEDYDKYKLGYNLLKQRGLICSNNYLNLNNIDKSKLTKKENDFVIYCRNKAYNKCNVIKILFTLHLCKYDEIKLTNMYNSLLNITDEPEEKILFDITIYFYQFNNECLRILDFDFTNHFSSIKHYFENINNLTINKPNYKFQVITNNNYIDLHGIIDILDNNETIIELKFTNNISITHILQLLLYNNNYFLKKKMEIYNLKTGIKYEIIFNIDLWKFNCFLCDVLNVKMNNNIIILDIETNTINSLDDFTKPENTEIIDRYLYEYNFNSVLSNGLIKNNHKLTTSHITGITNDDMRDADDNLNIFKEDVIKILKYSNEPIFIAHNGKRFDFPILLYYNVINKYDIKILDTLYLFRLYITEQLKSNKLIDLYNYICKNNKIQAHRAKEDVMLIVDIFKALNYTTTDFIKII